LEEKEIAEVEELKESGRAVKLVRVDEERVVKRVCTGHDTK
jgi:hypothetical protein